MTFGKETKYKENTEGKTKVSSHASQMSFWYQIIFLLAAFFVIDNTNAGEEWEWSCECECGVGPFSARKRNERDKGNFGKNENQSRKLAKAKFSSPFRSIVSKYFLSWYFPAFMMVHYPWLTTLAWTWLCSVLCDSFNICSSSISCLIN